jgi:hypothetical protein
VDLETVPRREFNRDFGHQYRPSQRLTMIGPPGRGKTRLGFQLLAACVPPDGRTKAVFLHGKIRGRDQTVERAAKPLRMRVIDEWPPAYRPGDKNRRGWVLIPLSKPLDTVAAENTRLRGQFGKAIHDNYHTRRRNPRITVVDESHQAHAELKLKTEIEGPLMRGRPDNAVWSYIQRGRFVSYHCYEAEHLFIFYDSDTDNQRRYADIGDVDPQEIIAITSQLDRHTIASGEIISQCLYMNRSGYMCIVDT